MFEPGKLKHLTEDRCARPAVDPFVAWLESRDQSAIYDVYSLDNCLICQYASHVHGLPMAYVAAAESVGWALNNLLDVAAHGFPDGKLNRRSEPQTFAHALSRARSYQANASERLP